MAPDQWRKKAGLSLREMARRLGCASQSTVYRWETGQREVPNSAALAYRKLSGGKVTPEDLERVHRKYREGVAA